MKLKTINKEETLRMLKKVVTSKPAGYQYPRHVFELLKRDGEEWALEMHKAGEYDPCDVQCKYEETIAGKTVRCIVGDVLLGQLNVGDWLTTEWNSEAAYRVLHDALAEHENVTFDNASQTILSLAQELQDSDTPWDEALEQIVEFVDVIDSIGVDWSSFFPDDSGCSQISTFFRYWRTSKEIHQAGEHVIPKSMVNVLQWAQDYCKVEVFNPYFCAVPGCEKPMTKAERGATV